VEVPALLWELDELARRVDFLSVGTNDLMQYLFAVDRDNKRVSGRFDPLAPPMLRALKSIADAGRARNVPVTLCGELGGKPLTALALLAIGFRHLSMSPSSLGPVKAMLLSLDVADATAHVDRLISRSDGATSIRSDLAAYAERHQLPV
jgi:phosphotransferase system enzyme I (PtsP)